MASCPRESEGFTNNRMFKVGPEGWASLVVQWLKRLPAMRETRFNPWVGKIPWRRKWQPTPVFLPGESHGQRSLVGYSPQGRKESDMTERLHFWRMSNSSAGKRAGRWYSGGPVCVEVRRHAKGLGINETANGAGMLVCDEEWQEMKTAHVLVLWKYHQFFT